MNTTRTTVAIIFAVLALPMAAVGQDAEVTYTAASNAGTIDDISQKSLSALRKETYQSEEDFYSVYNNLIDDKDYKVRCFYERPTGTRVKNHVCRANFVTNSFRSHAANNRNDISRTANQKANPALAKKTATYQEMLQSLIATDPELQAALIRYDTARSRFMAKRDSK